MIFLVIDLLLTKHSSHEKNWKRIWTLNNCLFPPNSCTSAHLDAYPILVVKDGVLAYSKENSTLDWIDLSNRLKLNENCKRNSVQCPRLWKRSLQRKRKKLLEKVWCSGSTKTDKDDDDNDEEAEEEELASWMAGLRSTVSRVQAWWNAAAFVAFQGFWRRQETFKWQNARVVTAQRTFFSHNCCFPRESTPQLGSSHKGKTVLSHGSSRAASPLHGNRAESHANESK